MAQQKVELVIAARKINGVWEAAVINNGAFSRAMVDPSLDAIADRGLLGSLIDRPEGASVTIQVTTLLDDGQA